MSCAVKETPKSLGKIYNLFLFYLFYAAHLLMTRLSNLWGSKKKKISVYNVWNCILCHTWLQIMFSAMQTFDSSLYSSIFDSFM